jgi:hypothetical protein
MSFPRKAKGYADMMERNNTCLVGEGHKCNKIVSNHHIMMNVVVDNFQQPRSLSFDYVFWFLGSLTKLLNHLAVSTV